MLKFTGIFRRRFTCALLAVCAVAAFGASAAQAAPDRGRGRVVISGSVHVGDRCGGGGPVYSRPRAIVHGDSCGCGSCLQKREYARGYSRGEARGSNAGYREGYEGYPFCDTPRDELCDNSRAYRDGYFAAFSRTYRYSYEQGRRDRSSHCVPRHCR